MERINQFRDMKYRRSQAAAEVWNGKFIVCGGREDKNVLSTVECFDPESGVWTEMLDMPTPRSGHSLISYSDKLLLIGGYDGKMWLNSVLELSNLKEIGDWNELSPMEHRRSYFTATVLGSELYIIGGRNETCNGLDNSEIFNGKDWRTGPVVPTERSDS